MATNFPCLHRAIPILTWKASHPWEPLLWVWGVSSLTQTYKNLFAFYNLSSAEYQDREWPWQSGTKYLQEPGFFTCSVTASLLIVLFATKINFCLDKPWILHCTNLMIKLTIWLLLPQKKKLKMFWWPIMVVILTTPRISGTPSTCHICGGFLRLDHLRKEDPP